MDTPGEDRTFTRTDPLIIEMTFTHKVLDSGNHIWDMEGRAYPGASSGSWFGAGGPVTGSLKEHFDKAIESERRWFAASYPKRPLKLKVTRPDVRQLTLAEAV